MVTSSGIEIERIDERVQVFLDGELVADSTCAIKLLEPGHSPVYYIPKNDLHEIDFAKYDDYHCPFKGEAELLTVKHGDKKFENIAWSYENPFDELSELKGRVAFYDDKVDEIKVA
ncbi:DUF427 domain-containing protein [Peredibacter sp. HCB2-198]|uniref:DUF427 domain-containing protein n=1 Tax=Peredibacter sp. HCB2-198 TaxID=3383025 RepID=UPI0038B53654